MAPFISDMEDSEESPKTAVSRHQPRHQVCSYTLLQVLVGVLVVLVLALTGSVIWMKQFQDCPERLWTVRFTGTNTNFTSPKTQEYVIFGMVFTKTNGTKCRNSFRLLQKLPNNTELPGDEIIDTGMFSKVNAMLLEGARLGVQLNCEKLEIDEKKSKLHLYLLDY